MSTEPTIQAIYDYAKLANFAYVDLRIENVICPEWCLFLIAEITVN